MARWSGQPAIKGRSATLRMILLSFVTMSLSFTWGIQMTYCTPYLLKLGLTKSDISLVWIAGPLSGLIVQPVVGAITDESKSSWGRRRPLMIVGSIIVAACLLVLGFTRESVGLFISDDEAAKRPTIVLAVLVIYALNFAVNMVTSCSKSLVVDTLTIDQQQTGAAWASRMSGIGQMMGYGAGAIDMVRLFGTALGDTQFKQLTIISTLFMLCSTAITCWAVTERVLLSESIRNEGRFKVLQQIYSTLFNLPSRVRAICWAQFWAWIGWYPFTFYSTIWVGEIYFRYDVPPDDKQSQDMIGAIGRIGSTSLAIYSFVTFAGVWILPLLVQSPDDSSFTDAQRLPRPVTGFLMRFHQRKPDLLTAWILGHLIFAGAMLLAPLASTSFRFATLLVCICGIPSAIGMWAPSAFLGIEVNKLGRGTNHDGAYHRIPDEAEIELSNLNGNDALLQSEHVIENEHSSATSAGELSGIYFGILNIYTTLPQFVGTFISTIVFAILEPGQNPDLSEDAKEQADPKGPNAIAVCLFIGGMGTLVAAHMTRKLRSL